MEIVTSYEGIPEGVDCLVALGKQLDETDKKRDVAFYPDGLSYASRYIARAAGYAWQKLCLNAPDDKIPFPSLILSGSDAFQFPIRGRDFLLRFGVNHDSIALERNSKTTLASARNVPKLIAFQEAEQQALVTVSYHAERAARDFERKGHPVKYVFSADDIIIDIFKTGGCQEKADEVMAWQDFKYRTEGPKEEFWLNHPRLEEIADMFVSLNLLRHSSQARSLPATEFFS